MFNEALCGAPRFQVPPCPTKTSHKSKSKKVLAVIIPLGILGIFSAVTTMAFLLMRYHKRGKNIPPREEDPLIVAPGRISYYELLRATDGYNENKLLGKGSFRSVYKGVLNNGTILAVKVFDSEKQGAFKSFDLQCEVLRKIRHCNLTRVVSSCSYHDFKALVLEYMPNGNLEKWLHSGDAYFLDTIKRLDIMIDVACALEYLHHGLSTAIVHCDLKRSNVLIDEDMCGHVSDFGIAKMLDEGHSISHTKTLATIGYIAPEYGSKGLASTKCDVYSYGILIMETFSRRKPSDDMFDGNLSLKRWKSGSLQDRMIVRVVDVELLSTDDKFYAEKMKCLSSVMQVGLNCCADNPEDWIVMTDVVGALKKIKHQFLAYDTPAT